MSCLNFFIDIETIPDQRDGAFEEIFAGVKAPGNYKKPESIDKWLTEHGKEVAEEEYAKTALKGISGEILSIAWAFEDLPVQSIIRKDDMPEDWLLAHFLDFIDDYIDQKGDPRVGPYSRPRLRWIGHNVIDFDMRYIWQRMIVNNIRPNFLIPCDGVISKHGGDHVYDTMRAWAGWKGYVSQDQLAKALGLPGKTDVTGADVWPLYQQGKLDEIRAYNEDDVQQVREIYRRLTFAAS